MVSTVTQMYELFLDGIKKERISTVPPSGFNRIINEAYDAWYRDKSLKIEQDQKKLDDLQELRVITDGVFKYLGSPLVPIHAINDTTSSDYGRNLFPLPIPNDNGNDVMIEGVVYPEYRRLLGVMFRLKYYGDPCHTDGELSDWKEAFIMRSNQRAEVKKNPFRRPRKGMIYYEVLDKLIKLDIGDNTNSFGYDMRIDYIKYPRAINFSENPSENVMCELQSDQCLEIIDIAVKTYIERVSDPRYQTQMYEFAQKSVGK